MTETTCPRGEEQHFDGICPTCGQHCQCQLHPVAQNIVWKDHQYGGGKSGYLQNLHLFTMGWRIGRQGEPTMERPWSLTTTLPIKKSVTDKWQFKTQEAAQDMAWRAARCGSRRLSRS